MGAAIKGEATAPAGDLALLGGILAEVQGLRADLTSGSKGSENTSTG